MILTLLLLPIVVSANPFHKYPYVFLLDIGNEEVEKVNTEQIRISSPGGSVALRYPAAGDGDDIAHVRVSGIDFGTDLKASIANGGPGYKYVVIVLIGNPGVEFDAVITIQTVPDAQTIDRNSIDNINSNINEVLVSENNPNDSAEDLEDPAESETSQLSGKNEELTQQSVDVYSYAQSEALSGYGTDKEIEDDENRDVESDTVDGEEIDDVKDNDASDNVYRPYSEDSEQNDNNRLQYDSEDPRISQRSAETYYEQSGSPVIVDENLYNKYIALKDHLYDGSEVYAQSDQESNDQNDYDRPFVEGAYDEYEEIDSNNFGDPNNNLIDNHEVSAVEQ